MPRLDRVAESAIVVPVPEAEPLIGRWRRQFTGDGRAGMPAHVTLLFPFVPASRLDREVEDEVAGLLAGTAGFEVSFRRTARFPDTLYLEPEPAEPFVRLTELLVAAYPEYPPYGGIHDSVIPHLGVAQGDDSLLGRIAAQLEPGLPVEARVEAAALFEQDENGRWRQRRSLPFGG